MFLLAHTWRLRSHLPYMRVLGFRVLGKKHGAGVHHRSLQPTKMLLCMQQTYPQTMPWAQLDWSTQKVGSFSFSPKSEFMIHGQ